MNHMGNLENSIMNPNRISDNSSFYQFETEKSRIYEPNNISYFIPEMRLPNFNNIPKNFHSPLSSSRVHSHSSKVSKHKISLRN